MESKYIRATETSRQKLSENDHVLTLGNGSLKSKTTAHTHLNSNHDTPCADVPGWVATAWLTGNTLSPVTNDFTLKEMDMILWDRDTMNSVDI